MRCDGMLFHGCRDRKRFMIGKMFWQEIAAAAMLMLMLEGSSGEPIEVQKKTFRANPIKRLN